MEIYNILKDNEIKITKARIEILDILIKTKESINAEEILNECKNRGNNINLSTVYRTLDLFLDKTIIDKFILDDGISIFKLHKGTHKHMLECDICHKEIELACPIKQIEELVKKQTGFTLTEHSLKMKGICEKCEKTSK